MSWMDELGGIGRDFRMFKLLDIRPHQFLGSFFSFLRRHSDT